MSDHRMLHLPFMTPVLLILYIRSLNSAFTIASIVIKVLQDPSLPCSKFHTQLRTSIVSMLICVALHSTPHRNLIVLSVSDGHLLHRCLCVMSPRLRWAPLKHQVAMQPMQALHCSHHRRYILGIHPQVETFHQSVVSLPYCILCNVFHAWMTDTLRHAACTPLS